MTPLHQTPLQRMLAIATALTIERDRWALHARILDEVHAIAGATGSTLYLLERGRGAPCLRPVIARNDTLGWRWSPRDEGCDREAIPALSLHDAGFRPDHAHVATHCALTRERVWVPDVASEPRFDMTGVRDFDARQNHQTHSLLTMPLIDHDGNVCAVVQLVNPALACADDLSLADLHDARTHETLALIEALCSLAAVAIDNQQMAEHQRDFLVTLSGQKESAALFETILTLAQQITLAEGGTLYLLDDADEGAKLRFAIVRNEKLGIHLGGLSGVAVTLPDIPLHTNDAPNHANIASFTALTREAVNIADAWEDPRFDFSGTRRFDEQNGYRSRSILCLPLANHAGDVIGVLQLLNARDPATREVVPFARSQEPMILALATYAAIVLENRILLEDHKKLLDAFIRCIASAIDAKSSHTSAHCQRVPVLTEMIAEAVCTDTQWFPDFSMTPEDWYELRVASWLHDCGKLSTPDRVLDKSTKLHTLRDGIEAVDARFEILIRDAEIAHLRAVVAGAGQTQSGAEAARPTAADLASAVQMLRDEQAFIRRCNQGGEFMSPDDQARVRSIASRPWYDATGEWRPLLSEEEVMNLCISRGTLNNDERALINDHMRVTLNMLDSLPFPRTLRRVPEYAGGHHEKMDGTGFPRGLTREQMSLPARMMAIADVFEALTASERPYKPPMKLSQALGILQRMVAQNHIDPALYQVFLEQRVWERYARAHLRPEQLDVGDPGPYR